VEPVLQTIPGSPVNDEELVATIQNGQPKMMEQASPQRGGGGFDIQRVGIYFNIVFARQFKIITYDLMNRK